MLPNNDTLKKEEIQFSVFLFAKIKDKIFKTSNGVKNNIHSKNGIGKGLSRSIAKKKYILVSKAQGIRCTLFK